MLVDFRNDLMKSFQEDKKKPLLLPMLPRRIPTINFQKNFSYHHPYHKYTPPPFLSDHPKNRTFLYIYDEHCDNIPFFSEFNSSEQTIIVSHSNQENSNNQINNNEKEEKCTNIGKFFRSKWRERQCANAKQQQRRIDDNFKGTMAVLEHGNELDLGVDSIFKVLTKHIKVICFLPQSNVK